MPAPSSFRELSALFRQLGAPDPEAWARSQVDEGIAQLHRFLFLRQAWRLVLGEDATAWIDRSIAHTKKDPEGVFAGLGAALERAVAAGASREDLTQIARGMQAELLFQFCYLLSDSGLTEPELQGVGWGLFQTDEGGEAIGPIVGLHESVLELDPSGREMRPRPSA